MLMSVFCLFFNTVPYNWKACFWISHSVPACFHESCKCIFTSRLPKIVNYLKINLFSFFLFPLSLNELSCQIIVSSSVLFVAAGGVHRVNVEQKSCDSFLFLCVYV